MKLISSVKLMFSQQADARWFIISYKARSFKIENISESSVIMELMLNVEFL